MTRQFGTTEIVAGGTQNVLGFADCLQAVGEHGGWRLLIPIQNAVELGSLPQDILRRLELAFYSGPQGRHFEGPRPVRDVE